MLVILIRESLLNIIGWDNHWYIVFINYYVILGFTYCAWLFDGMGLYGIYLYGLSCALGFCLFSKCASFVGRQYPCTEVYYSIKILVSILRIRLPPSSIAFLEYWYIDRVQRKQIIRKENPYVQDVRGTYTLSCLCIFILFV